MLLCECDSIVSQIEGDVLAVKKALVAVSLRIQDCPKSDKTRVLGSRHFETVPQETLPVDLHVGHISQRHSVIPTLPSSFVNLPSSSINIPSSSILQTSSINLPSSSIGYASVVHPLSIESEMVPILNSKTQKREIVFKILCANDKVGGVIGKGGAIVKALQSETGATVSVGAFVAECDERLIMVTASEVCYETIFSIIFTFILCVAKLGLLDSKITKRKKERIW